MCGIVGTLNLTAAAEPVRETALRQMLAMIRHRGPDQFGIYLGGDVGLGNARLSIIDLSSGQQPIANEDGTLWIVFNGEIFNHVELRPELEARGHRFATHTDTEVILHLYEEYGPACVARLNGQFAFAIWDARRRTLFLARDRLGICPLFYTIAGGALIFASEIKAILADRRVSAAIDPVALDQTFTCWSPQSPRTVFAGISWLPPGTHMTVRRGNPVIEPYWQLQLPDRDAAGGPDVAEAVEGLAELLIDATRIRLRADVPVGAYLSGGLDSSTIAAIIRNYTGNRLDTFSIAFDDAEFDESGFQQRMARFLGTDHQVVRATHADIGRIFPDVVWHTEAPLLRASPAPMFLLSRLVRSSGYKVVLTGEGADEFLAGYDIFKEAKVRRFWARQPDSRRRPLLFRRLYPWITGFTGGAGAYLAAFFRDGLEDGAAPDYSHRPRWRTTARTRRFFSDALRGAITESGEPADAGPVYPDGFRRWDPLSQAQYLEVTTFMSPYLLSSQGDRMTMANAVEGRFPFLDPRVIDYCNLLPPRLKLRGLTEKFVLKQLSRRWLPDEIWQRPKRPFRAPIHRSFFSGARLDWVEEMLSPQRIAATGLFKPAAVRQLRAKAASGARLGETDDMALVGILSSHLVVERFIRNFEMPPPLAADDDVRVCLENRAAA